MRLKTTIILALSPENCLLRRLFPAATRDAHASRPRSRSKERTANRKPAATHAKRPENVSLSIELVVRWHWTIGISIREYRGSHVIDVISRERNSTCLCACSDGIESQEKQGEGRSHTTYICASTLIFLFLLDTTTTTVVSVALLPAYVICSLRICDYSRRKYLDTAWVCLPSRLCTHSRHCCIPGFRCSRVSTSAACLFLDFAYKLFALKKFENDIHSKLLYSMIG